MSLVTQKKQFFALSAMVYNKLHGKTSVYSDIELVFSILMQQNEAYFSFWALLSEFTQLSKQALLNLFVSFSLQLNNKNQSTPSQLFRNNTVRKSSDKAEHFRSLFTQNLKLVLKNHFGNTFADFNHQELCVFIKENNVQNMREFWRELTELFEGKTSKQIRDYYGKAYQKVLYTQLSAYDKACLHAMSQSWAEQTPGFIAKKFQMIAERKDYFQQNIIMYIVNIRKGQDSLSNDRQYEQ
ncbi:Hypothetical_protein [Hexamita inflata]|uniref:Hypothetical_protein n=1 Tax=Hexamita inflata TaxID=28002 RepID=A0AA86U6S8_9EUKA|nr:Hypothetical protein HINF_LOCUS30914 [Hexamita inflata]